MAVVSSPKYQKTGQKKMVSSRGKGGLDWMLGKKNLHGKNGQALEQAAERSGITTLWSGQKICECVSWGCGLVVVVTMMD